MTDIEPAASGPHSSSDQTTGYETRRLAARIIDDVIARRLALDETLETALATRDARALDDRDKGLVRAIATSAIRHFGAISKALAARLERGLPKHSGPFEAIMASGIAQILYLDVPDHASVDLTVELVQADPDCRRYVALANAVLRRIAREKNDILKAVRPLEDNTPSWLADRWVETYGYEKAQEIAASHTHDAAVDLTVKSEPEAWAQKLDAIVLPTGSLRLKTRTAIPALQGFAEGEWWVQDAAAALPARLIAAQKNEVIADFCAAPGGKTAQLALSGAKIVAIDRSGKRLLRLKANLDRLHLAAEIVEMDALQYEGGPFDAILIDAPCSATGTIRRHPDVAWTKGPEDIRKLTSLQAKLLDKAASLLKSGGRMIYCTCSLEPEEGEKQIEALLERNPKLKRAAFTPADLAAFGGPLADALTAQGDLRTLPFMLPHEEKRVSGLDGFFASRLIAA